MQSDKTQRILVVGLGSTGRSLLRFFEHTPHQLAGFDTSLNADTKQQLSLEFPDVNWFSGSLADALAAGFDTVALSPGISRRLPELQAFAEQGGKIIGDVEVLARLLETDNQAAPVASRIVAITGSNGKTTVTSLVGHLCQTAGLDTVIAGNIGLPVLDAYLAREGKAADVWVLELSSFQLETTHQLNATAAVCLNVSEDHLDRYDDLLDYAHAKDRIFQGAAHQVINQDDALCMAMKRPDCAQHTFSITQMADYALDSGYLKRGEQTLVAQEDVPLTGKHNLANVLAAWALCRAIGLDDATIARGVMSFKGLPHRVEQIASIGGVAYIDDSKGTNVGATCAAISGLDMPIVLIAGGQGKGQNFTPLGQALAEKCRAAFLIGQDAKAVAAGLMPFGIKPIFCASLEEAVVQSFQVAQAGDCVLLSPACASLDMFRGYAHRSEVFAAAVAQLSQNEGIAP